MNNKIILGTVQFGMNYGVNNPFVKATKKESFKILDYAFKNGIKELDTSSNYGNSEEIIGSYIKKNPKNNFKINTKISTKNESLKAQIKNSLRRLGILKIHKLYFHSLELYFHFKKELELNYFKYRGDYFDEIGVSVYTNEEIQLLSEENFVTNIQTPFNLFDNYKIRGNFYEMASKKEKKIDVRSVFLQGLFFKNTNELIGNTVSLKKNIQELSKISKVNKLSIESLALSYVNNYEFVNNIIIGVYSLNQLKSNLMVNNVELSNSIINQINSIEIIDKSLLNPSKWKM